jgi:hypothetical protein
VIIRLSKATLFHEFVSVSGVSGSRKRQAAKITCLSEVRNGKEQFIRKRKTKMANRVEGVYGRIVFK